MQRGVKVVLVVVLSLIHGSHAQFKSTVKEKSRFCQGADSISAAYILEFQSAAESVAMHPRSGKGRALIPDPSLHSNPIVPRVREKRQPLDGILFGMVPLGGV
eukprot:647120-Amphidinium_carterae.3